VPWHAHEESHFLALLSPSPRTFALCHIFPHTTKACHHHSFGLNEDIKVTSVNWFQQQPCKSFAGTMHHQVCQWDTCLSAHGVYFYQPILHTEQFPNGLHLNKPNTINMNLDICDVMCFCLTYANLTGVP
jgi:hypothetical protein